MSDLFPAVAEAGATGEIADLFADIRTTVGVRVVNLVWRHLATIDGALPWAWAAVKPLYSAGMPDQAVRHFREGMIVPKLVSLQGTQPASVDAVLASYDHSNSMNLFALGALAAWLRGEAQRGATPQGGPRISAPDIALPQLASQADVSPDIWALVLRLNRFGDTPKPLILASMYRHLAHAPSFLREIEKALSPVHRDGSLMQAIRGNRARAQKQAAALAAAIVARRPVEAVRIEAAVSAFIENAIGKMVTICHAIRLARGTPTGA